MINFFFNIFHQNEKIKIIILVILMILAMLLEVAGISLIIPAILILLKGTDATTEMFFFKFFSDSLIEINDDNILIYGVLFLFFIFLVKYLIIGILYFFQYNFTAKLMLRISTDILNNYLKKPYIYFLNASSSRLINNLIKQVEIFVTQGLEPLITILSETILLVGIFFVLLYIDYKSVFFFLVVILLPSIFFYFLIKNKVKVWGNLQQTSDEKVLETLQHTLHGIKEIKIFIREKNFSNLFNAHFRNSVNMRKNLLLLNQFPRIWLEIISIFTICTLVIFFAKFNKQFIA
jgi:ABC-type multidrug transport system fused ATPase/permease subunit